MNYLNHFLEKHKPHPLESSVVEAFRRGGVMDVTKLAHEMAGGNFRGGRARTANRSYMTVAEDVIGYMHSQGKISVDKQGWYHLIEKPTEAMTA